jgi:hypothetical protein
MMPAGTVSHSISSTLKNAEDKARAETLYWPDSLVTQKRSVTQQVIPDDLGTRRRGVRADL